MDGSQTVGQGPMEVYEDFLWGPLLVPKSWVGDPWRSMRRFQGVHCWFPNRGSRTHLDLRGVSRGCMAGSQTAGGGAI